MFQWFKDLFSKLQPLGGIEITDTCVRYARLRPRGDGYELVAVGVESLRSGLVVSGVIRREAGVAAALRAVRGRCGFSKAHVVISPEVGYVFETQRPKDFVGTNSQWVQYQASVQTPIPTEDAHWSASVVGKEERGPLAVSVVPRHVFQTYEAVMLSAGFSLRSLELAPFAAARTVSHSTRASGVYLLVSCNDSLTSVSVVQYGQPCSLQTSRGFGRDELAHPEALDLLVKVIDRAGRSWRAKMTKHEDRPVRIVLCGESANQALAEHLARAMRLPCTLPDLKWLAKDGVAPHLLSRADAPAYVTVLGAALRR